MKSFFSKTWPYLAIVCLPIIFWIAQDHYSHSRAPYSIGGSKVDLFDASGNKGKLERPLLPVDSARMCNWDAYHYFLISDKVYRQDIPNDMANFAFFQVSLTSGNYASPRL